MAGKVIAGGTISLDGFLAGPNQSLENPMGEGAMRLHRWQFEAPEENAAERKALVSHGAYIMGRNMFGPIRGEWDLDWRGWWGEDPPYHAPVFVLTHYPREDLVMEGGTRFRFVTEGIFAAMELAQAAAGDGTISIAGGASTVRQYLAAGLIDELSLQVSPILMGRGERLLDGVEGVTLEPMTTRMTALTTHMRYRVVR